MPLSRIFLVLVVILTGLLLFTSYPIAKEVLRPRREIEEEILIKSQGHADCVQSAENKRLMEWNRECNEVYEANKTILAELFEQKSPLYELVCTMRFLPHVIGAGSGKTLAPRECEDRYENLNRSATPPDNCALPIGVMQIINDEYEKATKQCKLILK